MAVEFDICPVAGLDFNRKLDHKFPQIKESLEKSVSNQILSIV